MSFQPRVARDKRFVDGIVLLDKPPGISSNGALQLVRRAFRAQKAGHTGNLDVAASGLLPICLGEATKVCGMLLETDKRYHALVKLGEVSNTGDAEGQITRSAVDIPQDPAVIAAAVAGLKGAQLQTPPMYSALKLRGQPLYKLARQGIEVARAARPIEVYSADVLMISGGVVGLDIRCSKGTYIRVLAEKLGQTLGCGAHLQALRRVAAGPFELTRAYALELFTGHQGTPEALDELLLSTDQALIALSAVTLPATALSGFRQGQSVQMERQESFEESAVRVYGPAREFIGIGVLSGTGLLRPKRLLSTAGTAENPKTQ